MITTPELDALRDVCARLDWMRESGPAQQRRDVRLLLEATLDQGYLRSWAARMRLETSLDKVRRG